jgi:DNA repair protein RadC
MSTNQHPIIQQALALLVCEMRETDTLAAPDAIKDYLRLKLAPKNHEVFAVVFLLRRTESLKRKKCFGARLHKPASIPVKWSRRH